jgi:hypothetical protein
VCVSDKAPVPLARPCTAATLCLRPRYRDGPQGLARHHSDLPRKPERVETLPREARRAPPRGEAMKKPRKHPAKEERISKRIYEAEQEAMREALKDLVVGRDNPRKEKP